MEGLRYVALGIAVLLVLLAVAGGISACGYYQSISVPELRSHYVIEHVNVVDVVNRQVLRNHHVYVQSGVIGRVIPAQASGETDKPSALLYRIDGRGKYLIPGLWDMHTVLTQLSPQLDYPLFIAHGVTHVRSNLTCPNPAARSLYPCFADKVQWNAAVTDGSLIGPIIQGSGTFPVNGAGSLHPDSPEFHGAGSEADARRLVAHYDSLPPSERPFFIKNYNWVEPGPYRAMVAEARARGFDVGGHMPRKVGLVGAVEAGQRSFAHARLFMFECSSNAEELRLGRHWDLPLAEFYRLLLDTHDETLCEERYKLLSERDMYLAPTLITRRNDYLALAGKLHEAKGAQYTHYLVRWAWQEELAGLSRSPQQDAAVFREFYRAAAETIGRAHRQGAKVLVGTDANNEHVVPGVAVHEEMALLKGAGMSDFDVLVAATHTPAEYFRVTDRLGSVEAGKEAAMVLLNENPIENIANTSSVESVFQGDKIYNQAKLAALKARAEKRAYSHWPTLQLLAMWLRNPRGF